MKNPRTLVECRQYQDGVLYLTTPEKRVVRTRKDGTKFVHGSTWGDKTLQTDSETGVLYWELRWYSSLPEKPWYPGNMRVLWGNTHD